jgi:hypothetical protein
MLMAVSSPAIAARELTDRQLDNVAAGASVSAVKPGDAIHFEFGKDLSSGRMKGDGTIEVSAKPLTDLSNGLFLTNSTASQRGLVNIIAVNSVISVLLNLNVNINSTIGRVDQRNLTARSKF